MYYKGLKLERATPVLPGPFEVDMSLDPGIFPNSPALGSFTESDEVMIHYTVTEECSFSCRGCINALTSGRRQSNRISSFPRAGKEEDLKRDINGMVHLIAESGKERAVIVFYGGEPMLRLEKMNRVYNSLRKQLEERIQVEFMVITSGHYLEASSREYPDMTAGLTMTALSIDGTDAQHDSVRRGTSLKEIRRQVELFNRVRRGDVLIWSTMRPGMRLLDCHRSFMCFRERGEAEHFFWHWNEARGTIPNLRDYIEAYCRDLGLVMEDYVNFLAKGSLLSIVHVNELILFLLTGKRRGTTACGVENMGNFDIIGDGKVHGCADLPETMSIGYIAESGRVLLRPDVKEQLARVISYKQDLGCSTCGVEPYCGGRCPVQANTGGIERARQYCYMMREHVATIKQFVPPIIELMSDQGIGLSQLYASAKLARFSDVTP